jgi:uncharacterized membrane protein
MSHPVNKTVPVDCRITRIMEDLFKHWTFMLAWGIEAAAAVVIGFAAAEGVYRAMVLFVRRHVAEQDAKEQIRLRLGRWLAVALEFELAADILRTAIAPTWNEIGQLAAIIVLRTVLNYFLQAEIDKATARRMPSVAHERERVS